MQSVSRPCLSEGLRDRQMLGEAFRRLKGKAAPPTQMARGNLLFVGFCIRILDDSTTDFAFRFRAAFDPQLPNGFEKAMVENHSRNPEVLCFELGFTGILRINCITFTHDDGNHGTLFSS